MRLNKQKKGEGGFIKGAMWIAGGGFLAKVIGALYRIPLTNLIGGKGLGLYQLVYPIYCLLLTVSATGIPSSIAKLTAERVAKGEETESLFKTARRLFLWIGIAGTCLMAIIAPYLARIQNTEGVLYGYYALAPSVALTSAISVYRGWFQGQNNMLPTAFSEVLEQLVKVGIGLIFAYLFRENVERAVVFLLLAVSISELATLFLMMYFRARVSRKKTKKEGGRVAMKSILQLSIPITLGSILLPLSGLLDSVLVPKLLSKYASDAITLFGLFSGGAVTIVNLPVSVCYGIAVASVPRIASAVEKEGAGVRRRIFSALGLTALVGAGSAVGLCLFAEPATKIVFHSLSGEEQAILISLVKSFSISAFTLSCTQTLSACLTAQGKPRYSALSMAVAMVVKTILYLFWIPSPTISIFGLAYATNIAYALAFLLNLLYNLYVSKKRRKSK